MKVLFLPSWYPHRGELAAGIFIQRHAESVAKHTSAQVVLLFIWNEKIPGQKNYFVDHHEINKVRTCIVYYDGVNKNAFTGFIRIWQFIKAYSIGLKYVFRKFGKPDLCHVNVVMRAGIVAWWLKKTKRIPCLITEHWSGYIPTTPYYKGFWIRFFTQHIVKNASAVTTISKLLASLMQQQGLKSKYEVIPNSVNTNFFTLPAMTVVHSKCRFIHLSNFRAEKNIPGMMRVIKKLSQQRNDFTVQFIGGSYMSEILLLKNELALTDEVVTITPTVPSEQVVKAFHQSNVYLMFSNYEGLPCSLIEAWATGLPCICTRVGGIPDYWNQALGKMIEPADEVALLEQMNFMIDHHPSFNRTAISRFAAENFDEQIIGQQFFKLYESVIANRP